MNKYQKALENFGKHRSHINEQIHDLRTQVDELDTDAFNFYGLNDLQELVDKENPMKPKMVMLFGESVPTCAREGCDVGLNPVESIWHKSSYCGNCGQKIDWSDINE